MPLVLAAVLYNPMTVVTFWLNISSFLTILALLSPTKYLLPSDVMGIMDPG